MNENGHRGAYRGKRLTDLAIVALTLPITAPAAALTWIAVRFTSGSPVLFKQTRVGRHGRDFELLKFRTMTTGDNPIVPDPARITPIGKLLRRTSLDELPQLINVLRGDMSVIGPRPTLRYQVERYDDRQRQRLLARPGLTGLAQVSGRNSLQWAQRIELDIEYVHTQSITMDLRILLRTMAAIVGGEGVLGHDPTDPFVDGPTADESIA
jgi:lipopolysaccharide/colanic/teichoic acid biosynthesis glycosyltransferase